MNFRDIIKSDNILNAINDLGYTNATEIQEKVMPYVNLGKDVLGKSKTGTGKTLAFVGPILDNIIENKELQVIILAPTRELAIQISRDTNALSKYTKIKNVCVYGSSSINDQIKDIKKGVEIVVGTPGRIMDLIKRKVLVLNNLKYFVIDESDEMLSMGFQEELEFIFESTNKNKQVLLFSATMPKTIVKIAEKYMSKDYEVVDVENNEKTADNIVQYYYLIDDKTRCESMCRVMDFYNSDRAMIFCRTKRNADELFNKLNKKGYCVDLIHGDISQAQRIMTLDKFKNGKFNYLIATDVAARGIHVDDVSLIINYNMPESNEAYIHRIGRTGRANKSGTAISFIKKREINSLQEISNYINKEIIECKIPTKQEIINNNIDLIIKDIDLIKDGNVDNNIFKDYIYSLNDNEKNNILSILLNNKLNGIFGSDFSQNIEIGKKDDIKKVKRDNKDSIRIFLTIGKMDNIDKRSFLNYIEKEAKVKESTCSNVEIMPKFTFMNVKNSEFDKVFSAINNKKYNGRLIRIEKAKK